MSSFGLSKYRNTIILDIGDGDGNGQYDVKDFLELMKNKEELEKKTGVKRFDICIQNPPYSQRHNNNPIHFQFVENVLGIAEKQIVIMPSRILHTTSENYNPWKEKFNKTRSYKQLFKIKRI